MERPAGGCAGGTEVGGDGTDGLPAGSTRGPVGFVVGPAAPPCSHGAGWGCRAEGWAVSRGVYRLGVGAVAVSLAFVVTTWKVRTVSRISEASVRRIRPGM